MNQPLTVGVDVDDVCCDLLSEWLRRYTLKNLDPDAPKPEDILAWDMGAQFGPDIYNILRDKDLYEHILPIRGSLDAVLDMRQSGHRVVFVSSCVAGSVDAKVRWLQRWGFLPFGNSIKDFIACTDKYLVKADVLIDDHVKNIEAFPGFGLLVTRPHNSRIETDAQRVSCLAEAAQVVQTISGTEPLF